MVMITAMGIIVMIMKLMMIMVKLTRVLVRKMMFEGIMLVMLLMKMMC